MEQAEWKLVPTQPTIKMLMALTPASEPLERWEGYYLDMLSVVPDPPHLSMTKEDAAVFQDWCGMDGACAFHLIERHAKGWADTARMMEAWLAANSVSFNAESKTPQGVTRTSSYRSGTNEGETT